MDNYTIETGLEGPKHDPYSYTEITVHDGEDTIVIHYGLAEWLKKNGKIIAKGERIFEIFARLVGIPAEIMEEQHYEQQNQEICEKCGGSDLNWVNGFPGEELLVCNSCKNVCNSNFNEAAII